MKSKPAPLRSSPGLGLCPSPPTNLRKGNMVSAPQGVRVGILQPSANRSSQRRVPLMVCTGKGPALRSCGSESGSLLGGEEPGFNNRNCCFLRTLCSPRPPLLSPEPCPPHLHVGTHHCRSSLCFQICIPIPTGQLDVGLGNHILTIKTEGLKSCSGLQCDTPGALSESPCCRESWCSRTGKGLI